MNSLSARWQSHYTQQFRLQSAAITPTSKAHSGGRRVDIAGHANLGADRPLPTFHLANLPAPLPDARAARYSLGAGGRVRTRECPGRSEGDEETCTGPPTRARIIRTLGPVKFSWNDPEIGIGRPTTDSTVWEKDRRAQSLA